MGAFQRVSEHTVYAKYVKEIVFDGTTYDPELARSEFLYQQSARQFEDLQGVVSWARRSRYADLFYAPACPIASTVAGCTIRQSLKPSPY